MAAFSLPAQPVVATHWLNRSAGVSKFFRNFSWTFALVDLLIDGVIHLPLNEIVLNTSHVVRVALNSSWFGYMETKSPCGCTEAVL
jgi:hypothetical protein